MKEMKTNPYFNPLGYSRKSIDYVSLPKVDYSIFDDLSKKKEIKEKPTEEQTKNIQNTNRSERPLPSNLQENSMDDLKNLMARQHYREIFQRRETLKNLHKEAIEKSIEKDKNIDCERTITINYRHQEDHDAIISFMKKLGTIKRIDFISLLSLRITYEENDIVDKLILRGGVNINGKMYYFFGHRKNGQIYHIGNTHFLNMSHPEDQKYIDDLTKPKSFIAGLLNSLSDFLSSLGYTFEK